MSKGYQSEGRATGEVTIEVARASDGRPSTRVQLLKTGTNNFRDGRKPYVLGEATHRAEVIASTEELLGDCQLVIDYDHQTDFGAQPGVGGTAPAAGWVTALHNEASGIWATVEWNPKATKLLADREYRFISPVFNYTKDKGLVTRILRAGLTNTPALELAAVATQTDSTGDDDMKGIALLLGLAADASEADIIAAINTRTATTTALAAALKVAPMASNEEITTAATALSSVAPDPAKFVPIADLAAVQTVLASANARLAANDEATAVATVEAAIAAGKLLPAQKAWALDYVKKDAPAFASFIAATPAHALKLELIEGGKKPEASEGALTTEEKAVASQLGISDEAMLKSKKALAA